MVNRLLKWVRINYNKIVNSIAFYPAVIAIFFLLLSWLMLKLDFSEQGKLFKQQQGWISLKDASTARSILSTIAAGIISLTVFSFSMVMIVLNQAASQMSNRILNSILENRFQQIVLGIYIGTIVYALFLLSTIRDISSGIYIPAISIYLLIAITVVDIFLFIYFLNYVTQAVKYETIIKRVQTQTLNAMQKMYCPATNDTFDDRDKLFITIKTPEAGYFQGFNEKELIHLSEEHNITICFLHKKGTYLVKGADFMRVYGSQNLPADFNKQALLNVDFFEGQPISKNPEYGFRQLAEVAIKALSPGINDPATAVLSLNALTDLFSYHLHNCLPAVITRKQKVVIVLTTPTFTQLFEDCIYPIWNYGKNDRYIQQGLLHMLHQLTVCPLLLPVSKKL